MEGEGGQGRAGKGTEGKGREEKGMRWEGRAGQGGKGGEGRGGEGRVRSRLTKIVSKTAKVITVCKPGLQDPSTKLPII